ncbi:GntR family transcriptional regulator [Paenibacillus sp. JCM 10914]|uniref:GntR family transcriptional regulator n=1 Tax=Paenibacillus sp. JCM 10914 TaxID=1236974 RepID=UPI0003CC9EAE|nr:GntR family transcriptional regulator [Paenibacillus sp. JCM 10914]GAE08801.1 transcriptional regulator, GntR family [Paenibacillus sp. JCM 10914]
MSITRKNGPLYLQIKKIMKDRILHGVYPLGSHIPSEPQLEQEFKVSKMTVRNAIQELNQEGYVEKRSGIGTIVIRNTSFSKLSKGKRFTEILVEEGHQIRKRHLKEEWVSNEPGEALYEKFGERCIRIDRLYLLDGKPYIFYTHYLSSVVDMGGDFPSDELPSLYDRIEESQITLENFRDRFTTAIADEELASLLNVERGAVLLKRLRSSYDGEGNIMEYSIGYYNTELQHYLISYDI